jgi:branched-subunit amino acid aminotransferase/4-amino-4-deoxychorismate lyase
MTAPPGVEHLLETVRVQGGTPLRLSRHAARMARSAREFGWPFTLRALEAAVVAAAVAGEARLRILLDPDGNLRAETVPLPPQPPEVILTLSSLRVRSGDPLCRHKTLPRGIYDRVRQEAEEAGGWDGILLNERDHVAETGRANIVIRTGGEQLTPPLASGVLPGVIRQALLEAGAIREAALGAGALEEAEALYVTNALIGVVPVARIRGVAYKPRPHAMAKGLESLLGALNR